MKSKKHCYKNVDQISIANLITQHFILNFAKISMFQAETTVYVKSYQSKKLLKVVIIIVIIVIIHLLFGFNDL